MTRAAGGGALPSDGGDAGLPGRLEEGGSLPGGGPAGPAAGGAAAPRRLRGALPAVAAVALLAVSAAFIAHYFANQGEIDARILQGASPDPDDRLAARYGAGRYGSAHAHAALAVFVDGDPVDFGHPRFQLASRLIHFENGNPYQVHRHAAGAPLGMLFESFGMEVGAGCVSLRGAGEHCAGAGRELSFRINGAPAAGVSGHVPEHGDRVLVSLGDPADVPAQLEALGGLEIHEVPRPPVQRPTDIPA